MANTMFDIQRKLRNDTAAPAVNPIAPATPECSPAAITPAAASAPIMRFTRRTSCRSGASSFMLLEKAEDLDKPAYDAKQQEHEVQIRGAEHSVEPRADQVTCKNAARQNETKRAVLAGRYPEVFLPWFLSLVLFHSAASFTSRPSLG